MVLNAAKRSIPTAPEAVNAAAIGPPRLVVLVVLSPFVALTDELYSDKEEDVVVPDAEL